MTTNNRDEYKLKIIKARLDELMPEKRKLKLAKVMLEKKNKHYTKEWYDVVDQIKLMEDWIAPELKAKKNITRRNKPVKPASQKPFKDLLNHPTVHPQSDEDMIVMNASDLTEV